MDYGKRGMPEQAVAQLKRQSRLQTARLSSSCGWTRITPSLAIGAKRKRSPDTFISPRRSSYVSPFDLALIHAALGETDKAFALLDKQ